MQEIIIRTITSILLITGLYFSYKIHNFFIFIIISISMLSIFEFVKLIKKINIKKNQKLNIIIFGISYFILIVIFLINKSFEIKNIIFYFIIICIATDIGGLISGKIFKGKKLTKISPNKTFSGLYGSFILSFIFMTLLFDYLNLNIFILIIFTFSVCLLSQIGDLIFSFLKRKAKVKDTGNILPGHGGILDRVDGMIISIPINILFYTISI